MPKLPSRTRSRSTPEPSAASAHAAPGKSLVTAAATTAKSGSRPQPQAPGKTIYCTVASAYTLAAALRLRESLIAAHGTIDFCLLLTEHPVVVARLRAALPELQILAPEDVGCRQWLQMAFYLDRREYAAALTAALLRTLLADGSVIYLDPSCEVFSPLTELASALLDHDLVVATPSSARPPQDVGAPSSLDILRQDHPSLWLVGVAQGAAGERFLGWWQELVADSGPAGAADAPYAAGLWALAVAAAAPRLKVLASPRYGHTSAALNLKLWDGVGVPQTADGPLAVVRYPAAPPTAPGAQSHAPSAADFPPDALHARYLGELATAPAQRFAALPYSFGSYLSGAPIASADRLALWQLPRARRQLIDNPFAAAIPLAQWPVDEPKIYSPEPAPQRSRLTAALFRYSAKALDAIAPGSRDGVYNALQAVLARRSALRAYAGSAIQVVLPGSRDRVYNTIKAAAASNHPGLRRATTALMGVVGVPL